jgi:ribosomal protein S18 acetylase RimI-like enzyme
MSLPILAALAIRPAAPGDVKTIGRLGALLVRLHHDLDPARFIPATPQTEQGYGSYLGTQLAKPDIVILVAERVAEREGEVVGYTYAGVEGTDYMALRGPAGVIYDLVVDPDHRRQGVGSALLDATIAALEAKGAPRVVLSTAERNETAQRLFARAGFRRTMIEMTREPGTTSKEKKDES